MLSKTMALLLGIISRKPINPYELNKMLTTTNIREWYPIAVSTVYVTIKAADKKQYITGNTERSGNMPEKTVYAITEAGKKELFETLRSFISDFNYDITDFHIGIFLADLLGNDETAALLRKRETLLKERVQLLRLQLEKFRQEKPSRFIVMGVRQSLSIVEAQQKGAREILEEIEASS